MNIIDFLAIFPFIFSILLEGLKEFEVVGKTGKIIRLIRILRILRKNFVTTYYSVSIFYTRFYVQAVQTGSPLCWAAVPPDHHPAGLPGARAAPLRRLRSHPHILQAVISKILKY